MEVVKGSLTSPGLLKINFLGVQNFTKCQSQPERDALKTAQLRQYKLGNVGQQNAKPSGCGSGWEGSQHSAYIHAFKQGEGCRRWETKPVSAEGLGKNR